MKIIEGIRTLTGCPANIPDCSRDDLPDLFKELDFKTGVEIGVFMGQYTEVLARAGLQIYGVDPWYPYPGYGYMKEKEQHEELYQIAKERLSPYPNATILRETSMEAIKRFANESLDFVYIDGNHRFKYIAEDLFEWSFKVRKGGIICGHDYAYFKHRTLGNGCQVKEVVDAYVQSYDIKNFWVLGRRKVKKGEKRDRYRSWLIIKE